MLKEILINRGLTPRESEVAELVALGLRSKEVGQKLFIEERTVKEHLSNIYRKLGFKRRPELIIFAHPYLQK